jgi:GAF domain-containing protein
VEYPREFVEALLALSQVSVADAQLEDLLRGVTDLASAQLGGCDMAGVTLVGAEGPTTAVFTDPAAPEIDAAQYRTGHGPCMDAFREGTILRIDDTEHEERWPEFTASAREHGVRSTLSLPLSTREQIVGALNLYSYQVETFNDNEQVVAVFVAQAAATLANAQAYWAVRTLSDQLQDALVSRAVIEQAKGIVMRERACDADEAFALLARESQNSNRKVRDLAAAMVAEAIAGDRPTAV